MLGGGHGGDADRHDDKLQGVPRKGTNGVSTNGVTANFILVDRGNLYFCSDPISADPICPQPSTAWPTRCLSGEPGSRYGQVLVVSVRKMFNVRVSNPRTSLMFTSKCHLKVRISLLLIMYIIIIMIIMIIIMIIMIIIIITRGWAN